MPEGFGRWSELRRHNEYRNIGMSNLPALKGRAFSVQGCADFGFRISGFWFGKWNERFFI
jgi:hypothetical protein